MSDVITLLQDLVRIPSVNPASALPAEPAGEGPLADLIQIWLEAEGLPVVRQTVSPGRDNLLSFAPGQGGPGLLLEAHLDTVGTSDMVGFPFSGELREGKVWGRGACDTKASVAAMLIALRRAARENLPGGVMLALVVDEEYGFTGIERLVREPWPQPVAGAVVGEPTGLRVIDRHSGAVRMKFIAEGRAAHSAYPERGANAIHHAVALIGAFERHHEELRATAAEGSARTCTVTLIEGGEAINIVPARCAVSVDRRLVPGEDPAEVRAELEAVAQAAAGGRFPVQSEILLLDPPLNPRTPAPLVELALRVTAQVTGASERTAVNYSTDASNLAATGLEAIVLGPGDIAQTHGAEEWVAVEQVEQAAEVYYLLAAAAHEIQQ